ncbi:MAG: hypothetical protein HZB24_01560 [Desulfobacterales bacterium]|nr:hypothetical protein [Desulfobacterales bacterium]
MTRPATCAPWSTHRSDGGVFAQRRGCGPHRRGAAQRRQRLCNPGPEPGLQTLRAARGHDPGQRHRPGQGFDQNYQIAAITQTFGYDALNRRTASDDGAQESYAYAAGTNRLDTITGSRAINFDHDRRGNLIGRTIVTGSPPPPANPTYSYTYDGQRITKSIDGQTTV